MIDLHNHILPALDDGASDSVESLAIARQFVAEGVSLIAATPHVNPLRGTGPSCADVVRRVESLQTEVSAAGIPLSIVPGSEVYLAPQVATLLKEGTVATLGESTAVLVELPFDHRPLYMETALAELTQAGYRPVLAHPERSAFIQHDIEVAELLHRYDLCLQLTAPSLLGEYGARVKRTAEALLQRGLYTLASSDRHHPSGDRSLKLLHERLTALGGSELADLLLYDNPERLLKDQPVLPAEPIARQLGFAARLFGG